MAVLRKFIWRIATIFLPIFLLAACAQGDAKKHVVTDDKITVAAADRPAEDTPSNTPSHAAAFLTANYALAINDIPLAADGFSTVLSRNPNNIELMKMSFMAYYLSGNIDKADQVASQIEKSGDQITFGSEPSLIIAAENRDWVGMHVLSDKLLEDSVTQPLGVVMGAWALALQGQGDAGLTRLLELNQYTYTQNGDGEGANGKGGPPHEMFSQLAMLNEYLGRSDDALAAARTALDQDSINTAAIINMAGVIARQGHREAAAHLLEERLGQMFDRKMMIAGLRDGTSPLFDTPKLSHLLAEATLEASSVRHVSSGGMARLHLARRLSPSNDRVVYLLSLGFRNIGDDIRANAYHQLIKKDSPWSMPSQFLYARFLSLSGTDDKQSKQIFNDLINQSTDNAALLKQAGDAAGRRGEDDTALMFYEQAIALSPDNGRLHYSRGITLDRQGRKDEAEAALRTAIALNPNDAYALNYIGYWLLEHDGHAAEALGFIRTAIEENPQNGYFMDSLGWGYYKLEQYKQAVTALEQAVILTPVDPIITDHLGDVYSKLGRRREAVFQWRRALNLNPEAGMVDAIKTKIKQAEPQ